MSGHKVLLDSNVKDFCDISDDVNIINPFAEQGDGKDKKRSP